MKKVWNFISYLGMNSLSKSLNDQVLILSNRINFLILNFMLVIFVILRIQNLFDHGYIGMGSIRLILLMALAVLNLFLAYKKRTFLSRILIVILGPFLMIIFPILTGFVEEEAFVYNPYVIIGFSLLVPLLILPSENKLLFWASFLYYLFLVIIIDWLMSGYAPRHFVILDRIETFIFMNKLAQVGIFLFINLAVLHLRNINIRFDNELKEKNIKLDLQNEELKVTLDALKSNQQQLIHSEKMASLGTLTAGVAHEINNPLNFIAGGLNIIEEIKSNPVLANHHEIKEDLEASAQTIKAGLQRATKIVRSLTSFAYSGKPVQVNSDVHEIIDDTLLFLGSKLEYNIEIQKQYMLQSQVPVFPDLLHQVIINIIDNAIFELKSDLSKKSKIIFIKTYLEEIVGGNNAIISISNNGSNIPIENITHLFDPFFTTKKPGEGSGLGLSIAFTLVKKHHGSLIVQNLKEGVEFIIRLPLIPTDLEG
jgi:signal transduction histidine kinase